jgi:adenylyltransferase/sulfurtransferase
MPSIRLPVLLRSYTNGETVIPVRGENVAQAVEDLLTQFPTLRSHLTNKKGELRPFVNLFLNKENIKSLDGVLTPLTEDDQLLLLPSVTGG